jgi:endoglucanase
MMRAVAALLALLGILFGTITQPAYAAPDTIARGLAIQAKATASIAPKMAMPFFRGISLAGNNRFIGATTWPTQDGMKYWLNKKFNLFRIMTTWNNFQSPVAGLPAGPLNAANVAGLTATINYLTGQGAWVIIDMHDGLRYKTSGLDADAGSIIGQSTVTNAQFASFWAQIANLYKGNPRVIYELTNEPNNVDTTLMLGTFQAGINGIRGTGALNPIVVEGNSYSTALNWTLGSPANGASLLTLTDPANNLILSPHQYIDRNGGTTTTCYGNEAPIDMVNATVWAAANNVKLLLGEFGGGSNATCYLALKEQIDFVESRRDAWNGWITYAAYAGQSAYNTPDTFFLAQDPDVYTALGTDDLRLTNSMAGFLADTPPSVTNTAVAATSMTASAGTATNTVAPDGVTAARKFVEDTTTANHQLYSGNLTTTAGKKHTFQFDVQRDAGTRNVRLVISDTQTYANYTDMIISLDTGTIGQVTGNSTIFTYATGSARKLDNNAWRITVSTIIESITGAATINATINLQPVGSTSTSGYTGDGTSALRVWNMQWKVN